MDHRWVILITDRTAYLGEYERKQRSSRRKRVLDWPVARHVLPRDRSDLQALGDALGQQINAAFPSGITTRVVFPSTWCFVQPVGCRGNWNTQEAMLAVEEFLPVDLERLTCAAVRCAGRSGLVAAAMTEGLSGLVDGLSRHRIEVESLIPDVLVPGVLVLHPPEGGAILDQGRLTVFSAGECEDRSLGTGTTPSFRTVLLPREGIPDTGRTWRNTESQMTPGSVRHWFVLDDQVVGPRVTGDVRRMAPPQEAAATILDCAASAGSFADLRTGDLAFGGRYSRLGRRTQACLAAAGLLIAAIGLQVRLENMRYAAAAAELEPMTAALYREVLGDSKVPTGAALRLRSERIRLEGLTQSGDAHQALPATGLGSLQLLHLFAANAPSGVKLDVNEIVLDENGIQVAGQTTSHDAAGELVRTLNQVAGLQVEPPRTKLGSDRTVDFRLNAKRREEPRP
jgi:hypothetical protein